MSRDLRMFDGSITTSITLAFSNFSQVHPHQMKKTSDVKEESNRTHITPQMINKPGKHISLGAYQANIHSMRSSGTNISKGTNDNAGMRHGNDEEEKVNIDIPSVDGAAPGIRSSVTSSIPQLLKETTTIYPKQQTDAVSANAKLTKLNSLQVRSSKKAINVTNKSTESTPTSTIGASPPQSQPTKTSNEMIPGNISTPCRRVIFPTLHDSPQENKDGLIHHSDSNGTTSIPFQLDNPLAPLFPSQPQPFSTRKTESNLISNTERDEPSRVEFDMSTLYIPPFHHHSRKLESHCWNASASATSDVRQITHVKTNSPTSIVNTIPENTHSQKSHTPPPILKPSRFKRTLQRHYTDLPILGKVPSKLRLSLKDLHLCQLLRTRSQEDGNGGSSGNVNTVAEECNSSLLDSTNHELNLQINDFNLSKLDEDVPSILSQKTNTDPKRISFCKCLLSSSLKRCLSDTCLDQRILVDVDEFVGTSDRSKVSKYATITRCTNGFSKGSQSAGSYCSKRANMTRHISHEEMGQKKIRFDPRIWVHEFKQEPNDVVAWYTAIDMDRFKHDVLHRIRRYERRKQQMDILSSGTGRIISLAGQSTRRKRRSVRAIYTNPALTADAESSDDECNELVFKTDPISSPLRQQQKLNVEVKSEIRRVLLVEPHDIFTRLLTKSIHVMLPHAQIMSVRSGEEALECIARATQISQQKGESYEFDLIIAEERLDTQPDKQHDENRSVKGEKKSTKATGSTFLRMLKDQESSPQITFQSLNSNFVHRVPLLIGMSAYSELDGDKLRKSGSDFVWSKPPPKMDSIMKSSILKTLKQKRSKGEGTLN